VKRKLTFSKKTLEPTVDKRAKYFSSNAVGKKGRRRKKGRDEPREHQSRTGARQTGWSVRHPGAPQGGRCSHAGPKRRTERMGRCRRNGEPNRIEESRRNMVASPHAKTSRRCSPRAALTLLDKAADILDKTLAYALLRENSTCAIPINRSFSRNNYCKHVDFNFQLIFIFHTSKRILTNWRLKKI